VGVQNHGHTLFADQVVTAVVEVLDGLEVRVSTDQLLTQ
jgi:hypothetical protein